MNMISDPNAARKEWIGILAKSKPDDLARLWGKYGGEPDYKLLRAPEIGTTMVRGRAGAVGAAFNLGEMTITRCSVRLATGQDGHAYVQGRDKQKALQAALVDALMQTDVAGEIEVQILTPLRKIHAERCELRAAKAAATKVEFFTLARGED